MGMTFLTESATRQVPIGCFLFLNFIFTVLEFFQIGSALSHLKVKTMQETTKKRSRRWKADQRKLNNCKLNFSVKFSYLIDSIIMFIIFSTRLHWPNRT